jgi:hypothetical protein
VKAGGIVIIVFAGLMMVVGAIFGVVAADNLSSADRMARYRSYSRYSRYRSSNSYWIGRKRRKGKTQRGVGIGLGVVGLLGLVGGIMMVRVGGKKAREAKAELDRQVAAGLAPQQEVATSLPGAIVAAGVLWIICGGLGAIGNLIAAVAARGKITGAMGIPIAIAFFVVGIQSVSGKAKDSLGNSIGSLIIGGLGVIGVLVLTVMARHGVVLLAMVYPLGLITAGILGLVGRSRYVAYRQAKEGTLGAVAQPAVAQPVRIPAGPLPMANWYVGVGGAQQGPVTLGEVQQRISAGTLDASAHVFHQQIGQWTPITTVPQLARALQPPPAGQPSATVPAG